jgi:hypothetical protein
MVMAYVLIASAMLLCQANVEDKVVDGCEFQAAA